MKSHVQNGDRPVMCRSPSFVNASGSRSSRSAPIAVTASQYQSLLHDLRKHSISIRSSAMAQRGPGGGVVLGRRRAEMSGGMLRKLVAANNQLVLWHVHVWSFQCACLRSFKFGDRPRRSHELGGLFFNLSFQCQFLGCFLSGEESACHMFQLSCIPTLMPPHLRRFAPLQVLWLSV